VSVASAAVKNEWSCPTAPHVRLNDLDWEYFTSFSYCVTLTGTQNEVVGGRAKLRLGSSSALALTGGGRVFSFTPRPLYRPPSPGFRGQTADAH
jgi:hypothetical protein